MPGKLSMTTEMIAAAIRKAQGLISSAAELLGCEQTTVYRRIAKSAALQRVVAQSRERTLDRAELALAKAVQAGEGWAVCFTLKCLGKNRGFVERQELHHTGELEPKRVIVEHVLSDEIKTSAARLGSGNPDTALPPATELLPPEPQ